MGLLDSPEAETSAWSMRSLSCGASGSTRCTAGCCRCGEPLLPERESRSSAHLHRGLVRGGAAQLVQLLLPLGLFTPLLLVLALVLVLRPVLVAIFADAGVPRLATRGRVVRVVRVVRAAAVAVVAHRVLLAAAAAAPAAVPPRLPHWATLRTHAHPIQRLIAAGMGSCSLPDAVPAPHTHKLRSRRAHLVRGVGRLAAPAACAPSCSAACAGVAVVIARGRLDDAPLLALLLRRHPWAHSSSGRCCARHHLQRGAGGRLGIA